jgi:RND superfamily putative drug exporter
MRILATWCVRHRRLVVAFWVAALVVTTVLSRLEGSAFTNSFTLPHTESAKAIAVLKGVSPKVSGDTERVVIGTSGGSKLTDARIEARVNAMLGKVAKLPHVIGVVSPYERAGASQVSRSGDIGFAVVTFDRQFQDLATSEATKLVQTARSAQAPGLAVGVSGPLADLTAMPSTGGAWLGLLLAGVVLLVVFGSVFAMALPLISAVASLGTAVGIIGLLSHVLDTPQFSMELVLLIGLGVGIDYALFIVTRHRQGLMAGLDPESSIVDAIDTSGRAVLFAGVIVCVAVLGMLLLGVSFLYAMAFDTAIGIALTMVAALTLLPALLGFIGPRVLSRRRRRSLDEHGPPTTGSKTGFWARWASFVARRPVLPAVAALVLIVVMAIPFFSMRMSHTDEGNDAGGTATRQAFDMLSKGFGPGFNGPLEMVVVSHGGVDHRALDTLVDTVRAQRSSVATVPPPEVIPAPHGTTVTLVNVIPTSAPQDVATIDLINRLRQHTIPNAVAGSGLTVYVGGITAVFADFTQVVSQKLPLFVGVVVLFSFLLLAAVFRSIAIPLTAAIMNLLSIAAAFGVLVTVFQHGTFGGVLGVHRPGPIEAFLPVVLFAVLFGLSMDYEVFLISRIHEEWRRWGDNRTAVRNGLAATGKTITAAALIMILVFGSFILGGSRIVKEVGLGQAVGILVDAVVVRMALVPAVMLLLGKTNWWFPKSLDRVLPRLSVDPDAPAAPSILPDDMEDPVAPLGASTIASTTAVADEVAADAAGQRGDRPVRLFPTLRHDRRPECHRA